MTSTFKLIFAQPQVTHMEIGIKPHYANCQHTVASDKDKRLLQEAISFYFLPRGKAEKVILLNV